MTRLVFALALVAFYGCATADPPVVRDGCAVDPKKVCQYTVDYTLDHSGAISYGNGIELDRNRLQTFSVRHPEFLIPFKHGSGTLLRCVLDSQAARVTDANIAKGPQFTDADIEHPRQTGLCQ